MYVVLGATGNTGSIVADTLLAKKEKVRVVGRDAHRLERFKQKGAEPFVAELTDGATVTKALSGAKAVYALIPPNIGAADPRAFQERISDAVTAAIQKNGVKYVVMLSSVGADKSDGTGPVVGLHNFEQKLNGISGLNAICLRAGYFMENLLPQVGIIQSLGNMAGPVRADLPIPMIANRDIGVTAAKALLNLDFTGKHTPELLGARDVTYLDAARIIAAAIAKPGLTYFQAPDEQLKAALMGMGMSPKMADLLLEMAGAMNRGHLKALEPRSSENTMPTSFETFVADEFLPTYRGKAAQA
jgi:uncharacterized protein YbjT (DUF2867 family)